MLDKLKKLRDELDSIIKDAEPNTAKPEGKPLPANAKPAYDACRQLWEAAQKVGAFNIFAYIPGLQPLAAQMGEARPADKMNADIIKLGFSVWGQEWLSHDENAALIDPDYQRHFLGYRVVRKNQNDHTQGFNRVP